MPRAGACSATRGSPRCVAQRPLPSMMMAMWSSVCDLLCIVKFPYGEIGYRQAVKLLGRSRGAWQRAVPVDGAGEVHGAGNGEETGDGSDEQGVVFEAQQQVDEGVEQCEHNKRADRLRAACEDPAGIGGEKGHGGRTRDEEAEIETDALGQGKQQQVEDDLRNSDEHVLRWVDALARGDFEDEVGEEKKTEEEKDVFE